ncbi:hypothetical protein [Thalassobacillus sp. B23F22_16]|uniref:hypothetical protein n=1 Tax=Thalassobacillus sp. B23F22_16 TaxID=3459513 RepID=UPI000A1CDEC5
MGELVHFPHKSIRLTNEELAIYWSIRARLEKAATLEEIRKLRHDVKAFRHRLAAKYGIPL